MLKDVCLEISFAEIVRKYSLERGDLLRIYAEGGQFAGMVHSFCCELGYRGFCLLRDKVVSGHFDVDSDHFRLFQVNKTPCILVFQR